MSIRIKVAHIITRLDKGGSTDNTLYSALFADKEKYEVHVLSGPTTNPPASLIERVKNAGVRFVPVWGLSRSINPIKDLFALFILCRILKLEKYHIIHTHTSKAGIIGRIAARIAGMPIIVHTPHGHIFWGYYPPFITKLFMSAEKLCGEFSKRLIALTEQEKNDYITTGVDKIDKIRIVPSGIEFDKLSRLAKMEARSKIGLPEERFIIGTIARFDRIKNHAILVCIAKMLEEKKVDFFWVFAGDGPLLYTIKQEFIKEGLADRSLFLGWTENIFELLPALEVFVLASLNEGMGRVFVEAQAAGCPVVASNVCGIKDVVRDCETGFLFDPKDPEGMALAIQRIYQNSSLREKLGIAAKESVMNKFDVRIMAKQIEEVYQELLNTER